MSTELTETSEIQPAATKQEFLDKYLSPPDELPPEDRECPICYVEYRQREGHDPPECAVQFLPCNHVVGRRCLKKHVDSVVLSHNKCPICRCTLFVCTHIPPQQVRDDSRPGENTEQHLNRENTESVTALRHSLLLSHPDSDSDDRSGNRGRPLTITSRDAPRSYTPHPSGRLSRSPSPMGLRSRLPPSTAMRRRNSTSSIFLPDSPPSLSPNPSDPFPSPPSDRHAQMAERLREWERRQNARRALAVQDGARASTVRTQPSPAYDLFRITRRIPPRFCLINQAEANSSVRSPGTRSPAALSAQPSNTQLPFTHREGVMYDRLVELRNNLAEVRATLRNQLTSTTSPQQPANALNRLSTTEGRRAGPSSSRPRRTLTPSQTADLIERVRLRNASHNAQVAARPRADLERARSETRERWQSVVQMLELTRGAVSAEADVFEGTTRAADGHALNDISQRLQQIEDELRGLLR